MDASNSRVGMIRCDSNWLIKGTNRSARELLGQSELVGKPLSALAFGRQLLQRPSCECPYSRYIDCSHLGRSPLLVNVARSSSNHIVTFEPAGWILSTWRQFDDTDIIVADETGRVIFVHYGYGRMPGIPKHRVLGRNLLDLSSQFAPEIGSTESRIEEVLSGKTDWEQIDIPFPDSTPHSFNVRLQPWRYCGCICGIIIVATDVTPVKDAAVQDLSAVVYRAWNALQHEVRNPLQTMQAVLDTLRQRQQATEKDQNILRMLAEQIQSITACLSDQFLLNSLDPSSMLLIKLSDVVRREIQRAAMRLSTSRLLIIHRILKNEPRVRGRPQCLGRVFAHLFRNTAVVSPEACVYIAYTVRQGFMTCTLMDNGPGFAHDVLSTDWMERRVQTEHLGVALAASTLEAHGGTVVFGKRDKGGAFVELRIPIAMV